MYKSSSKNISKCNVRISSPSATTITDADTYYQVAGTFTDGICKDFTLAEDGTLTYGGANGRNFLFNGASDIEVDKACEITYSLEKNGDIDTTTSTIHTFLSPSKVSNISVARLIQLNSGDVLKVKVKSDTAEVSLTAQSLFLTFWGEN